MIHEVPRSVLATLTTLAVLSAAAYIWTKSGNATATSGKRSATKGEVDVEKLIEEFNEQPARETLAPLLELICGTAVTGSEINASQLKVSEALANFVTEYEFAAVCMLPPVPLRRIFHIALTPAGEVSTDFVHHILTIVEQNASHELTTDADLEGDEGVFDQLLTALVTLGDTADPTPAQLMMAKLVTKCASHMPFDAWKVAMDRLGLTLEQLMRTADALLVRESSALLRNLGVVILEFAAFRFGREWVDFVSKDLDGFLSRVFTAWSPDLDMERAVRVLVMAHAFDGTFANRAVASPSFALALRPQLREKSETISFMSDFFASAGRDAKLTEILHSIPEFKDQLLRASIEKTEQQCTTLLEFHYPDLDRTQDMIDRLQVLVNDEDWPEDGTQICELLGAIPGEIMGLGDPMAKFMKFNANGNLATVMQRFIIEYPELLMTSTAALIISGIADATPDLAPNYLRLTVVPMFARMRMALDDARTDLRQVMSTLYRNETPDDDDLERTVTKFDRAQPVMVYAAVFGLDPCARRMLEEMPECRETLDDLAEIVEELVLAFVTDEEGKAFSLINMNNATQILSNRTGKAQSGNPDLYGKYVELAGVQTEKNVILGALHPAALTAQTLMCFDKYRARMIKALVPMMIGISSFSWVSLIDQVLQLLFLAPLSDPNIRVELRDGFEYASNLLFMSNDRFDQLTTFIKAGVREAAYIEMHRIAQGSDAMSPVQWNESSSPDLFYSGVYGNRILNRSLAVAMTRASHGATGRGKIGYWLRTDRTLYVIPGFSTRKFDINKFPVGVDGEKAREQHEWYAMGMTNGLPVPDIKPNAGPELHWVAVLLDLDEGTMSICRPGTVAVPVASGIDKSKVWYPTALCVQIATSETDFVRSLPHGYLSFAEAMAADPSSPTVPTVVTATGEPAKRLIVPSPVAYLPPANDHLFAVEHGATVNCLPTSWSHHSYFEAHFTPASPIVGLGIQRGGLHLMWVATRGVEMLVSFSAGTTFLETLEASTAWTELVPAALRAAARGDLGIKNDMADTVWLQWERKEAASDSKSSWTPTATATGPSDPLESTQWMGVHAVAIDSDTSSPLLSAPTTEAMTLGFGFGANWSDPTPTDDDELGAGTGLPIRANGQVEVVILRRSKAHGTKNPCAVSRIIIGRLVPDNRLSRYTVPVLIGGGQDSVVAFSEDAAGRPLALGVDVI